MKKIPQQRILKEKMEIKQNILDKKKHVQIWKTERFLTKS